MIATLTLVVALAAPLPERERSRQRAFELVQLLADSAFKVRENASDELVKLGAASVDALRKGLSHPDTEVGERCRRLLPQALDCQLEEQIEKFLAKPDGPVPDDLPGLKHWLKIAGRTKESRENYALIVKEHRRLLHDVEANPDQASQKYQSFGAEIYNRTRLGTVAARRELISRSEMFVFFFLGGDPNCRKNATPTGTIPYIQATQFLNGTQVTEMLSGASKSESFQKIFLSWLEQERYATLLRRGFQLAATANLKEAGPIAIKMVLEKGITPAIRSATLLSAAKLFGPEDVKKLEPLMQDKTLVGAINVNGNGQSTEIRDIALGIAVQLTGQKISDYGFERFRDTPSGIVTSYIYFAQSEKGRDEAFKKWKEWSDKNKK